jgi:hypothetical protein
MVRTASSLRCRGYLVGPSGEEIGPCVECVNRGITSSLVYGVWDVVSGVSNHTLQYDVLVVCDGTHGHTERGVYSLMMQVS